MLFTLYTLCVEKSHLKITPNCHHVFFISLTSWWRFGMIPEKILIYNLGYRNIFFFLSKRLFFFYKRLFQCSTSKFLRLHFVIKYYHLMFAFLWFALVCYLFCFFCAAPETLLHHERLPCSCQWQTGAVWDQRPSDLLPAHCQDFVRGLVLINWPSEQSGL